MTQKALAPWATSIEKSCTIANPRYHIYLYLSERKNYYKYRKKKKKKKSKSRQDKADNIASFAIKLVTVAQDDLLLALTCNVCFVKFR